MRDLGYSCCASKSSLGEVLSQFGPLDAPCVGALVAMMAATVDGLDDSLSLHGAFATAVTGKYLEGDANSFDADAAAADDAAGAPKALTCWNVEAFVEALKAKAPGLDWPSVFDHLDTPETACPSIASLQLICQVHRLACRAPLPARCLLGEWSNVSAQLSMITHLLKAPVAGGRLVTTSLLVTEATLKMKDAATRATKPAWAATNADARFMRALFPKMKPYLRRMSSRNNQSWQVQPVDFTESL